MEILNEIHVTQLLFSASCRVFPAEPKNLEKESSGKTDESHYYLQHMCSVSPEKSFYTSARGDGRGNYNLLAQKLNAWQPYLCKKPPAVAAGAVAATALKGQNLFNSLPHLSGCSMSEAGGMPAVSHIYQSANRFDHGQINQATWTTPSPLWTARGSFSPVDSQSQQLTGGGNSRL